MPTLRELIADGRVHVFDGAMGTMLYGRGVFLNVCYDELNLRQPDLVRDIHREYVRAGAELLETNTFGANPVKLASLRARRRRPSAINTRRGGAGPRRRRRPGRGGGRHRAARRAASSRSARPPVAEAQAAFARQASGLLAGGVDGFVLETFSDVDELGAALRAVRAVCDLPVIAQMTVGTDGKTHYGTDPRDLRPRARRDGRRRHRGELLGGPARRARGDRAARPVVTVPLSAQPNAGLPREVGDRKIYMASPEYMASYARRMVEAGARFVGGCCGTTPEHIKAIVGFVQSVSPRHVHAVGVTPLPAAAVEPVPLAAAVAARRQARRGRVRHHGRDRAAEGRGPGADVRAVPALKAAGVDAVNVPDGPRAQSRMGALLSAVMIEREVGLEAVVHYACRDRNLLGMLSDLLGAAAAGLRNLLIITGDPPKMGPYPDATAVFDIDSIGLTNLVSRLNRGLDPGGNPIGLPTRFAIGVGVNPAAPDLERELRRFAWKVEAGAEFAITQPVFDLAQLDRFLKQVESFRIPIVAGIWPLVSLRNAEFLANEVPGVSVPDAILERMRRASDRGKEAGARRGRPDRARDAGRGGGAGAGRPGVGAARTGLGGAQGPRGRDCTGRRAGIYSPHLSRAARPLPELVAYAGPPHRFTRPHQPVGRGEHVPGGGPRVRRDRGAAARPGHGRGGADPRRSHSQVLRARPHGDRGAGGLRRRWRHHLHVGAGDRGAGPGGRIGRDLCGRAQHLGQQRLLRWGKDDQQRRYFPRLTRGLLGAFALSEPGSGSDAFALATRAERVGEGWELTGRKFWITNGAEAGIFIVFANTDPAKGYKGITAFLVEREFPGFAVGKKENKLGIRASSTTELILEQCRVPSENVLGPVGQGYKIAIETLNEGRIGIGAQMIGDRQRRARGGHRVREGAPPVRQGDRRVPGCAVPARADARPSSRPRGSWSTTPPGSRTRGSRSPSEAAMAKLFSSQVADRTTSSCLELFGGYGYSKEYPAEKYYRDAKIGTIYEGTSNMQLQTIAKALLK